MNDRDLRTVQDQLATLQTRLAGLEAVVRTLVAAQTAAPTPDRLHPAPPPAAPLPLLATEQALSPPIVPIEDTPALPPRPAAAPAPRPKPDRSLESRIGSQWFNRIGILAVLIAMSWFLKFAIDNHWIGPLGRVVIGLVAGAGLIGWSERFQRRGYPVFAYSLKAVGSGILYLALWAAFSLYHLIPGSVAFAAMVAVTAFNGFMSWMQEAELLALYSIVGAFSTPLLLSTGENHENALFTYLFVLDLAVLTLCALRPWSRLLFSAFTGTVLFFIGWWLRFYTADQLTPTALFLLCFFLLFALAPRLVRPIGDRTGHTAGWDTLATVVLPIANAALSFLAFYVLFDHPATAWSLPWLAVAYAAFYLVLLRLPAVGILRPNPPLPSALLLTSAVVFLALAIPLKTQGRWLTIGWLVEGAALLWAARRFHLSLLRFLAILCLVFGIFALLAINPPASLTPLLNQRFATYLVAIAVFVFVALLARSAPPDPPEPNTVPWRALAPAAALLVNLLILAAVSLEIHNYWWAVRWHGDDWTYLHDYRIYTQFTYSAFFMLFGAILLAVGFWRHSAFVRWQALILLAVSIAKVFLGDVSSLSQGYRILSFLGLGILLLAVSFVYQRDWLHLRTPEPEHDA